MTATAPRYTRLKEAAIPVTFAAVTVPAILMAAFLSVSTCIGWGEDAGVAAGSPRGQACDVPGLGPWGYVIGAAGAGVLVMIPRLRAARSLPTSVLCALVPISFAFAVPLVLSVLPRG